MTVSNIKLSTTHAYSQISDVYKSSHIELTDKVMREAMALTVTFLFSLCLACKGENVYHVVINKESPCTAEQCLTLEEYVEDAASYFTSGTTLQFLPGNHTLSTVGFVEIWNVSNLALVQLHTRIQRFA